MKELPPSSFQLGLAAAEKGDFARAHAIAGALLARDENDVHGLQILGFTAFRQGDNQRALEAFWRANRAEPGQPALLYWMGVLFKERGDFDQAEKALRSAVRINPHYGEAWCHLGEALYLTGRKSEASLAFDRALEAEPNSVAVLAKCARFCETVHDLKKARNLAEKAHRLNPEDELPAIALAEIDLREKKFEEVMALLRPLVEKSGSHHRNKAKMLHLIATAQDRLGLYDASFKSLELAHALQQEINGARAGGEPSPLNSVAIARTRKFLEGTDFPAWTKYDSLEGPAPTFLLGFVRSGTTWLDQILSSHPQISVMEEEDNFLDIWPDLIMNDGDLRRLPLLSKVEIDAARGKYWARARKAIEHSDRSVIVDKVPLNTAQLGLIYRIFPDAKIILALRDPRDCVLSAFQQHFQINAGMFNFLDMETAARFYDNVMSIGEIVRRNAPLAIHEVRYEKIVADLESEIRQLIAFLDLSWNEAVLDYRKTATDRAIRTPSRQQVVQAPYATSIGKWRNYRSGMTPALEILAPWVVKFGYDAD